MNKRSAEDSLAPHIRELVDVLVQAVGEGQQQSHLAALHKV
jgi:hypothetical protein